MGESVGGGRAWSCRPPWGGAMCVRPQPSRWRPPAPAAAVAAMRTYLRPRRRRRPHLRYRPSGLEPQAGRPGRRGGRRRVPRAAVPARDRALPVSAPPPWPRPLAPTMTVMTMMAATARMRRARGARGSSAQKSPGVPRQGQGWGGRLAAGTTAAHRRAVAGAGGRGGGLGRQARPRRRQWVAPHGSAEPARLRLRPFPCPCEQCHHCPREMAR